MIKAGIVGVSGYGGIELFHLLNSHPDVEIVCISTRTYAGKKLREVYPHLQHIDIECKEYSPDEIAEKCDVVFTSVPHGGPAMEYAEAVKKNKKIMIDLSADFRLKDKEVYKEWYKIEHKLPEFLKEAVYGLPELHKEEIKNAWLIGNPGCYTTAGILALVPLIKNKIIDINSIIIDAKSGTSGAGRKLDQGLHFSELDENFKAYKPADHRHAPEIEQEISYYSDKNITLTFVPHLVPMVRGILSTSYANFSKESKHTKEEILNLYKSLYKDCPFVRIFEDNLPNTKYTAGTNFIDISAAVDDRNKRIVVISAIDNLIKGAAGQAVQNMNIIFGLKETTGLYLKPLYP